MFGFVKQVLVVAMRFFSYNILNVNSLECVSMNNQVRKTRTKIININNNEPVFCPFGIKLNKCSGSCNNINDPYAKMCAPDAVKNMNLKVCNLVSWSNQIKHIEWHKTWKCKCKLNSSVCNNKQRRKEDKFRWECKELVDNIDENAMVYNGPFNDSLKDYKKVSNCRLYIVLFVVLLVIKIVISSAFIYFHWYLKKSQIFTVNIDDNYQSN